MNLVVGGSGTLGRLVVQRLLAAGEPVRVMTRQPDALAEMRAAGVDVVRGDLLDHESVVRACAGADKIVAAAHSILGRGRAASVHVDGAAHRRLIDIARPAGVRHFVYTSAYDYAGTYQSVPFFRIKHEVERHLQASGLGYTILRPTAFMDFHAHVLIGEPILKKGKVVLFGRGEELRNFVAADDVAQVVVIALRDPSVVGDTIDVGGPEDLTSMDVVRVYERASGKTAKVMHVPLSVARVVSKLVKSVHSGLSQVLAAAVLADTTDQRFDSRALSAQFNLELTTLEEWLARASER